MGDEKKIAGVFSTFSDFTERKIAEDALRNSENKLKAFFRSTPEAHALLDKDLKVLTFNESANQLMCNTYGRELHEGDTFTDVIFPQIRELMKESMENALRGVPFRGEFPIPDIRTGKSVWWLSVFTPAYDELGNIFGVVANSTNIDELKRTGFKLEKLNKQLDRFLYSASHDMRAPLTTMMGLIRLARLDDAQDNKQMYLEKLDLSVQKLDSFLKEIMQFSRNTHERIANEPIDLDKMTTHIIKQIEVWKDFSKFLVRKEIEKELYLTSDPYRINTVLENILRNSYDFADFSKHQPEISIRAVKKNSTATIEVTDNGIGIMPEHLKHVCDMFYRGSDRAKGSGLGLYLAQEVIIKLKGKLSVHSQYGVSTTVTLELPDL